MNAWTTAGQATALCLALIWLLLALATHQRRPLQATWALFCGSIAMLMARALVGPEAAPWYQLFGLGACMTCNGFWLVSRCLFRADRPVAAPHLAYAGVVALLIIVAQQREMTPAPLASVNSELLQLLSSAALVMAFWEGLRGWRGHRGGERRMRVVFLASYGTCVAGAVILPAAVDPAGMGQVGPLVAAVASVLILLTIQGLVKWRLAHPLTVAGQGQAPVVPLQASKVLDCSTMGRPKNDPVSEAAVRDEDRELARLLEDHMRTNRPYLETELKLGHLAHALDVSEYRVSRAVRGPLQRANISQYVNDYRLEHARQLLADPACHQWSTLVVGLESGFGSLGAFHRAFRRAEGCTPGEYRTQRSVGAFG